MFTFFLMLSSAQTLRAYDFSSNGIYYEITSDSTVGVTYKSSSDRGYSGHVSIPGTVTYKGNTYKVTKIGQKTFQSCNITGITMGANITEIGNEAFAYCSNLTSVTIGSGVISIYGKAFSECNGLTEVTIPQNVAYIGSMAFYKCGNLTKLTFSDGTEILQMSIYEFSNCPIKELYLGRELDYESSPFESFKSLTSLVIGNCVTKIGRVAFAHCSNLADVTIGNNVEFIGYEAFWYCSGLKRVTIPNSVKRIGESSFSNSGLTSLTIPNNVTAIDSNAFYHCDSLTELTFSDGIDTLEVSTNIWSTPFDNCPIEKLYLGRNLNYTSSPFKYNHSLKSLIIGNNVTSIGNREFYDCSNLAEVTIPDNITSIKSAAFSGCSSLSSLTIPNSVTEIGSYAFYGCSSLTSIIIPDGITEIGDGTFGSCKSLTKLTIPNSVVTIGGSAFQSCDNLVELTIGSSVRSIGIFAFFGSSSIMSVISLNPTPPEIISIGFDYPTELNGTLHVPAGCKSAYQQALYWKDFLNIVDDASTDIAPAIADKQGKTKIYTLDGKRLNTTNVAELPKGVYIINGKKHVVK